MSVAFVTMEAAYGLRLGVPPALHHHHHYNNHRQHHSPEALRFSVVNILRPDFGREAILGTKSSSSPSRQLSSPLPRDLSLSSSSTIRLSSSPTNNSYAGSLSSHCGLTSPLQRLSRSGSLESLASNRSSVAGSSVAGGTAPSVCSNTSSSSSSSTESGGDSGKSGQNVQWPAWVYCTRYSDRPSSGKYCDLFFFNCIGYE